MKYSELKKGIKETLKENVGNKELLKLELTYNDFKKELEKQLLAIEGAKIEKVEFFDKGYIGEDKNKASFVKYVNNKYFNSTNEKAISDFVLISVTIDETYEMVFNFLTKHLYVAYYDRYDFNDVMEIIVDNIMQAIKSIKK